MRIASGVVLGLVASMVLTPLAACGGGGGDGTSVFVVALRAELLAAREGDGPWQTFTVGDAGHREFFINGPFTAVGVCEDFGGEVYVYSGGPEDAEEFWDVGCGADATVSVTLNNQGGGTVYVDIGLSTVSVTSSAVVQVPPGVTDVVMVDRTNHRVAVRRAVSVFAPTTIDFNLTTEGSNMVSRPLTGGTQTTSWFTTAADVGAFLATDTGVAWTVPPSLAMGGDKHRGYAREVDSAQPRVRWRSAALDPVSTAPMALSLPAGLDTATFAWTTVPSINFTSAATWTDYTTLYGYQNDADYSPLWYFTRYGGAGGPANQIAIPELSSLPGWKASWNVAPSMPWNLYLDVSNQIGDDVFEGAGWDREANPPAVRAALEQREARLAAFRSRTAN